MGRQLGLESEARILTVSEQHVDGPRLLWAVSLDADLCGTFSVLVDGKPMDVKIRVRRGK